MAPTQLSIVLERMLNELGIADLSTFEAVLILFPPFWRARKFPVS